MSKTEIKAVQKTLIMWEWLRDHPDERKHDYIERLPSDKQPIRRFDCYLCDIWIGRCQRPKEYKTDCPLDTKTLHCHNRCSPWHNWLPIYSPTHATKQAQRIINACKRWLKKHGGK